MCYNVLVTPMESMKKDFSYLQKAQEIKLTLSDRLRYGQTPLKKQVFLKLKKKKGGWCAGNEGTELSLASD